MMSATDNYDVNESPKKGPTLSTSTSSFEALDPHDPNLSSSATTMFQKTNDYLYGEFTSTQDSYKRLEEMNRVTLSKYTDFHCITGNLSTVVNKLDNTYTTLGPCLQKIDNIEECILKLEKMAHAIDAYSKRLEAKFKYLSKR